MQYTQASEHNVQLKIIQTKMFDRWRWFLAFDLLQVHKMEEWLSAFFQLSTCSLVPSQVIVSLTICSSVFRDHVWREVMESTNQYVSDELRGLSRRGGRQRNRYGGGGGGKGIVWESLDFGALKTSTQFRKFGIRCVYLCTWW